MNISFTGFIVALVVSFIAVRNAGYVIKPWSAYYYAQQHIVSSPLTRHRGSWWPPDRDLRRVPRYRVHLRVALRVAVENNVATCCSLQSR